MDTIFQQQYRKAQQDIISVNTRKTNDMFRVKSP